MKQIVRDIEKNGREIIRISLDEFEGHQLVAVRTWYTAEGGALKPTPKGLSLAIRHLPAIRQALEEAERIARAAGLLPP